MSTLAEQRLRPQRAAAFLGVSLSALAKWRMQGKGPPFHRMGARIVFYVRAELDEWLVRCDAHHSQRADKI